MTTTPGRSRLIHYSGVLAVSSLLAVPAAILLVRLGLTGPGLGLFAVAGGTALLSLGVLFGASLPTRYRHLRGRALRNALPALPPALLILLVLNSGNNYPPIHDITTDTAEPPRFDSAIRRRGPDSNPLTLDPAVIAIQQQHYADLDTIASELSTEQALAHAATVAGSLHWVIHHQDLPGGVIEASQRSFWFGFVDDVVIRVRPRIGGSAVDLRSVSRLGRSDLGANAKRIRAFIAAFRTLPARPDPAERE